MVDTPSFRTCFVVMPISMPGHLLDRYGERTDHFPKIFSSLILPAIEAAGLEALSPVRTGSENIQAAIINDLHDADLVLGDLSALNPNVFLEIGIRSALDKPMCLVWDGFDHLPFDAGTINTHRYDPRPVYELNGEIEKLAEFISATIRKSDGRNELWKYFGSASTVLPAAELDPEDASIHARLDRLVDLLETRQVAFTPAISPAPSESSIRRTVEIVEAAIRASGTQGLHGSRVRHLCVGELDDSFETFVGGDTLSQALRRNGLVFRTDKSGNFYSIEFAPSTEASESDQ